MIKLEKTTIKDLDFLLSFGLKGIENTYIIKQDTNQVGVIEYIQKNMDDNFSYEEHQYNSIYIEYIDILTEYRRKGIASKVINFLSDEGNNYIYGNSLPNDISVSFWKSLGADFEGEDENLDIYKENNECLSFSL